MKLLCNDTRSVSRFIKGKWEHFTFDGINPTKVPDKIGEELLFTYPDVYSISIEEDKQNDIGSENTLEELKKQLTAAKTKKTKAVKASQAEPDNIGLQEAALEADSCVTELENKIKTAFPDTE